MKPLPTTDQCAAMKLGIFAKTFTRPTVEEVFDGVVAHGLQCVQFNFASAGLPSLPEQIEPALVERVRQAASERRIAIAAVSGTFNLIHPDPRQRRDGLRRLAVIVSVCHTLGAPVITLCTGSRDPENMWQRHPDNDTPEAWRDLIQSLHAALEIAGTCGVTLGIEPEVSNVVDSARKARRLIDEMRSPQLKIILDAANLFQADELPRQREILNEAFDLLGREIVLAHAKELGHDGHAGGLPLGAGALHWEHYLLLLREANFTGSLIMHGFEERQAARSTAFLRSALEKAP